MLVGVILFGCWAALLGTYRPRLDPLPPLPAPNGYDDYVAAAELVMAHGGAREAGPGNRERDPATALQVDAAAVSKHAAALAGARRAAGKDCRARLATDLIEKYPELGGVQDLARLLAAEAHVRAARGDYAGALSDGIDSIRMGADIRQGGGLVHAMTGRYCEATGVRAVVDLVVRVPARDAARQAARLQQALLRRPTCADNLRAERNRLLTALLRVDHMPGGLAQAAGPSEDDQAEPGRKQSGAQADDGSGRIGWLLMRDRTLRDIDDCMGRQIAEAEKPPGQRKSVAMPRWGMAALLMPDGWWLATSDDEAAAHSRLLLAMLAIRAYRGEHGALPKTLADVGLDARLTSDPYSGKPLVYKPGGGYLLYSVGPDSRDDGGVPANEGARPVVGDLGVAPFRYRSDMGAVQSPPSYRRVPHMLPPKLPPGAPPLFP